MNIRIEKGSLQYLSDCEEALLNSELGRKYFEREGSGKNLISFVEMLAFENANKVFFVVADFNPDAKRLYNKLGYQKVGEIPNLYRKGINEYLMMKEKEE